VRTLQLVGDSKYGGGGYLLIQWCSYLLNKGWQVDVLATDPIVIDELKKLPVNIIDHIRIPRDIEFKPDFIAFIQLFKLLSNSAYDVVHTYTATPGFLGRIVACLKGVPVVLHHQAGWTVTEFSTVWERIMYTPLEYLATVASTRGICVSHAIAKQARQWRVAPTIKLVTICNGIDPQKIITATEQLSGDAFRRSLGIPKGYLLIGSTARLAPQKDVESLVRSMAVLREILPGRPFVLLLAGDGPERRKLEELTRSLGLDHSVRFLGFLKEIPNLLASLDIFVSPSLWEGLSISLMEAMVSARPIISTNILSNAELIEHEVTGLLVPPKSPMEIAKAIARFVKNPELAQRCVFAARRRVLEFYTLDRMLDETWNLYANLLDEKKILKEG
jgi:glycosyltransferase involved in cell wall biosynthesis